MTDAPSSTPASSPGVALAGRVVTMDDRRNVIDDGVVYVRE